MGTLALGSLLPFEDRTARTLSLLCGRAFPRGGQGALIAPPVRTDVRTDVRNTDAGRKPRSVRISVCEIRDTDVRRPYGRGTNWLSTSMMSLALRILCRAPPLRTTVRVQSARDHRHGGGCGWFQRP